MYAAQDSGRIPATQTGACPAGGWVVMAFVVEAITLYFHVMSLAVGGKGLPIGQPIFGQR